MVEDFRGFLQSQILNCYFTRCRPTNQWYDQNFVELFLSDAVDGLSPRLDCVRLSQDANMLALFERLKELWYNRQPGEHPGQ